MMFGQHQKWEATTPATANKPCPKITAIFLLFAFFSNVTKYIGLLRTVHTAFVASISNTLLCCLLVSYFRCWLLAKLP